MSRGDRKGEDDDSATEVDAVDVVAPLNVGSVASGLMVSVARCGCVSTSSCNAFCCLCSGICASFCFDTTTAFGFDPRLNPSSILPSVGPAPAKYCATKSSDAVGLLVSLPPLEYDKERRRIGR